MRTSSKRQEIDRDAVAPVEERLGPRAWECDLPARRRHRRWTTDVAAFVDVAGQSYSCRVADVSPGGARICLLEAIQIGVGSEVAFDLEGWGEIAAKVRHGATDVLGLEFMLLEGEEVELTLWLLRRHDVFEPGAPD